MKKWFKRIICKIFGCKIYTTEIHNMRVHMACSRCGTKIVEINMFKKSVENHDKVCEGRLDPKFQAMLKDSKSKSIDRG